MSRVIIAGSREFNDYNVLLEAIDEAPFYVTYVISGGAKGVDAMGERYASEMDIPMAVYLPDWSQYGKVAGPMRNAKMADGADALIALWDGKSKGTKNMIETAQKKGLKVYVKEI